VLLRFDLEKKRYLILKLFDNTKPQCNRNWSILLVKDTRKTMEKLLNSVLPIIVCFWAAGCEKLSGLNYDYSKLENASVLNQQLPVDFADLEYVTTSKTSEKVLSDDKINLVFFGFPSCHGVCPTTMVALSEELKSLPTKKRQMYKVVFINVDQEASFEDVEKFLEPFGESFLGVVPSNTDTLNKLAKRFGAYSREPLPGENTNEKIIHSSQLHVVSPQRKWIGYYSFPLLKGKIASDFSKVLM